MAFPYRTTMGSGRRGRRGVPSGHRNGVLAAGRFTQTEVTGTFYCFALTYDGSGATNADKAKAYIGTLTSAMAAQTVTFQDAAIPATTADNSASSFILGSSGAGQYLDGVEGEAYIDKRTLSLSELENYRQVTKGRYV